MIAEDVESRKGETIMARTKCAVCGSDNNQDGDMFCGDCGRRLSQSPATICAEQAEVKPPTETLSDGSAPIREPPAPMRRVGGISGLVIFFLGIVLLVATFVVALLAFLNPDRVGDFAKLIPAPEGEWGGALKGIGYAVAVGFLFVMGSVGGRIASLGIKMFKAQPSSGSD